MHNHCARPELPATASDLVPHRSPIVFVDELLEADDTCALAVYTVPEASPYLNGEGVLVPEALLEIMAQCFAAWAGLKAGKGGSGPSWGYLAAVRSFSVQGRIRSGDRLLAGCTYVMSVGPIHVIEGWVRRADEEMLTARAQLKIFIPEAGMDDADASAGHAGA